MLKSVSSRRRQAVLITVICAALLFSQAAFARHPETMKTVIVIGTGKIYKGNSAAARQDAISNGLKVAVDAAVVELLSPEGLVGHFQIINQAIQEGTADFIQGYKVLGEYQSGEKYRAVVEATISIEAISSKLASVSIAVGQRELPKVLFFISQQNSEGALEQYWWGEDSQFKMVSAEKTMAEVLIQKGFLVADPEQGSSNVEESTFDFAASIDAISAILLAADYGAKVVIIGTAVSRLAPNTMGASRTYTGIVTARALVVADGTELAFTENEAVVAGSDDVTGGRMAIDAAAKLAAGALVDRIVAVWGKEGTSLSTINITVEGTRDLANFVMFRRVIKKMPDVTRINTLEMKPDQAVIEVEYQGTVEAFANNLMLNPFENFRLDIYDVSEEVLRVAIIPR
jgi:hypothetical protein